MRYLLPSLLIFSVSGGYAWAETASQKLNQIDAEQQYRQRQQSEQLEQQLQSQADVRLDTAANSSEKLPSSESLCFSLTQIELADYSSAISTPSQFQWALTQAQQDLQLQLPYCLGNEGLSILMKQIQNRIIERGYITTRVVVPEQDLTTGKLTLAVILGKVRHTLVADSSKKVEFTRLNGWTGLTFSQGELLNVRDIEQSLENLKRVPTVEANIEILPAEGEGAEMGESDLKVLYQQKFPLRGSLNLDDAGSKSTGKWQGSASLSWDNPFSANDLFYASYSHSIRRSSDEVGRRMSKNYQLYYSVPFGYWTLTTSHGRNDYRQEVFGAYGNSYTYAGESTTDKVSLSYLAYRDAVRKTTLSGGFWSRHSKNYVDETEVEVQRRRMSGWEAGISHREYVGSLIVDVALNYKWGTGMRGALEAPEELFGEGTSRPRILSASVGMVMPFVLFDNQLQYQSQWQSQWNKRRLIAQDRFSIGNRYSVRGFDGELTLSGERGWYWRNELAWHIKQSGHWLYVALDGGRVSMVDDQLGQSLIGSAVGVRGDWKGVSYDYFVGKPLKKPKGFRTSNTTTGFNVGYSF